MVATAEPVPAGTVRRVSHTSDLTDEQWALLERVSNGPGERGPERGPDLRRVVAVDARRPVSRHGGGDQPGVVRLGR